MGVVAPGARLGSAPWILMAGIAVVGTPSLVLAPVLTDVATSLGTGPAAVGRAAGAYGIATALSALALGRLVDALPRTRVLQVAGAGLALGLLLCAAAPSWGVLAAGQVVAGLAAGVVLPVTYALAAEGAPAGAQARVLGRVLLGWSVALVVVVPLAAALTDVAGWRTTFLVLAGAAAAQVGLLGRLPAAPPRPAGAPARYRDALGRPGVRALLLVVLAYMAAFYGTYAYLGDHVRAVHDGGAGIAALVPLAYGLGFGAAGLLDARIDRTGPARLLLPTVLGLAGLYASLPAAARSVPVLLAVCAVWGLVNHAGLGMLVTLLGERGGTARGPVLALYSTATYLAAAVGTAALGPLYERRGILSVTLAAGAGLLVAALPAARVRTGRAPAPEATGTADADGPAPRREPGRRVEQD